MQKSARLLLTKPAVVYALATLCCLLWGSAFPAIKIGYRLLRIPADDPGSQILFGGLRFTLTGVLTVLIFSLFKRRLLLPRRGSLPNIGKLGFMQTLMQYIFFYIGLSHASAAKSSVINGSIPFFAILFACFLYRQERFTRAKLLGSLLGFGGILLVNLDFTGLASGMRFTGEGFILISSVASALSSSMTKRYSQTENPVVLTGYQFLFGGIIMTAVGLGMGGTLRFSSAAAAGCLLYLSLLSVVSYSVWSVLLQYNDVSRVVVFSFAIPVFGVLLSTFLPGETRQALSLQTTASLLLVSVGVVVINRVGRNSKNSAALSQQTP